MKTLISAQYLIKRLETSERLYLLAGNVSLADVCRKEIVRLQKGLEKDPGPWLKTCRPEVRTRYGSHMRKGKVSK